MLFCFRYIVIKRALQLIKRKSLVKYAILDCASSMCYFISRKKDKKRVNIYLLKNRTKDCHTTAYLKIVAYLGISLVNLKEELFME